MSPYQSIFSLAALAASVQVAYAGLDTSSPSNLVLYWGQNSLGQGSGDLAQQRLSYYCESKDIDVVILSFVTAINGQGDAPEVNFANQGDICEPFPGTNLLECPEIAEDIKTCQDGGKTVLLALGGATYSEGGFASEEAAVAGANLLWETFGPTGSDRPRPFGDSVIDGFDLDFESAVSNMVPFANELNRLFDGDDKTYYLSAAPQCPYPDAANREMFEGGVKFDAIWIQFYNNFCGLNSFTPDTPEQASFNYKEWHEWATTGSGNPDVKIVVGAPANTGAAGSGYVDAQTLAKVIDYCKEFDSFGGVMLWDASQGWANEGFVAAVKAALGGAVSRIMRRLFA